MGWIGLHLFGLFFFLSRWHGVPASNKAFSLLFLLRVHVICFYLKNNPFVLKYKMF
jgi:hypothetical protein